MSQATLEVTQKYVPHKGQVEFHNSLSRFRVLACGRRWGKTLCGANETLFRVLRNVELEQEGVGFCVAPTYWHTQKQWTEFLKNCPRQVVRDINRAEHRISLRHGNVVWFKSADNPDSLRSEGLDWLWMDEGGQIKEEAWTLALRPALMDKKGCAWFTGTPKGHNWYFMLWMKGRKDLGVYHPDYESWQYSSKENPYIDPQEIEDFARDMPKMAYKQEILAEFIEDIGAVFRGVDECISGELEPPLHGHSYVLGVDLAKHTDYTVVCVIDVSNNHLVHFDRWSQYDWVYQRKRIAAISERYGHARILVDSTGLGDPVYDELRRMSLPVDGYKFTNASKKDLVENLAIQIENQNISYPKLPTLINELKLYAYEKLPSGLTRYTAPSGYNDDCVIALALAVWMVSKPKGFVII